MRVEGRGFRVEGFGLLASGFGFRVSGFGFRVSGFGFRVSGFGFRVSGSGFRVSGRGWYLRIRPSEEDPYLVVLTCHVTTTYFLLADKKDPSMADLQHTPMNASSAHNIQIGAPPLGNSTREGA